ncbi:MAG: hypothetical protein GF393_01485 [Armatimonadia bacterium]|nr:hypothetical protein [Armatimonadia bacterium]
MRAPVQWLMVVAALMAVAHPSAAQVDVQASLSRETVEVGETVELTVAVTGALLGVEEPVVPEIDYLRVVSTASQNNISVVNGDMQRTTVFHFGLQASREGTYTIPRMDVAVGDEIHSTPSLTLRVVPAASAAPQPPDSTPQPTDGPDFGVPGDEVIGPEEPLKEIDAITEVDEQSPWVGEQITLTLKFLQAHTLRLMGNAEYEPPSTEGLVAEPLPDEPQQSEEIDGRTYEVATRRTALIAPAPGEYTIGPATITFRRGFMHGEETITTDPITLTVRPLPGQGRPENFTGAVGSIQLGMSLSTNEVRVGEAVSLRLDLNGTGDLRQIEPPEVTVEGDARVYQSGEDRQIGPQKTPEGYAIGGRVSFDYLIMPRSAGTLRLKPIVVHYFNPDVDRYQSAQTSPATITVLPGETGETTAPGGGEIRYIKEDGLAVRAGTPVTSSAWYWGLQALPLLGLGWALRERAERLRRDRDPRYRRRVEAARNARRSLRGIPPAGAPAEVYHRLDEVLAGYIAARTDGAAAAMSSDTAREALLNAGVPEDLADRASELLQSLRAGVYAPGASDAPSPGEAIDATRDLIDALEGALQ